MSSSAYFALCLLVALIAVGFLSAFIAQQRHAREMRREQALRMLAALARYGDWVAAQRRAPRFLGESPDAAAALDEACTIRMAWFPELAGDMAELLAVHNRLMNTLAAQDALRQRDPEAWLESDHDDRFMALWRHQLFAMQAMRRKFKLLGGIDGDAATAAPSPYPTPGVG